MTEAISMRRRQKRSEQGYTLLVVIFLMAILTLVLAVAVPKVRQDLQRDREVEAMHRGKQYIRAIQLYYRKFHAYPPNMDALKNTNGIRFLRKEYVDPITGKNDWKPILFGQNKVPTTMGFFGQPLAGSTIAGIGPGGTGLSGNTGQAGTLGSVFNSQQTATASPTDTSGSGSNTPNSGTNTPAGGSASAGTGLGATDAFGNPISGTTAGGPTNGQALGGGGIIGVTIPNEKQSILIYKKQVHYNQWEFVYDPIQETLNKMGPVGGSSSSLNGGSPVSGAPIGNGLNSNGPNSNAPSPWGPNGNLPVPGEPPGNQPPSNGPWSPNGNLPSPPPQPQ
jgi:type II secretory pathway pseudopilin PulG